MQYYYLFLKYSHESFVFLSSCHLPMLYIGLEYGLTNNSKLAERFFSQALCIAPEDPFVMHEVGVVAFQNGEYVSLLWIAVLDTRKKICE